MTQNEYLFGQLREVNRANVAREVETRRHNLVTEGQTDRDLAEKKRHNVAAENISIATLTETTRHNKATEDISERNLAELTRHNITTEELGRGNLFELERHNLSTEAIQQQQADTQARQASTAASRLLVDRAQYFVQNAQKERELQNAAVRTGIEQQRADTAQYEAKTHRTQMYLNAAFNLVDGITNRVNNTLDPAKRIKDLKTIGQVATIF